jgi:hypothetical protein
MSVDRGLRDTKIGFALVDPPSRDDPVRSSVQVLRGCQVGVVVDEFGLADTSKLCQSSRDVARKHFALNGNSLWQLRFARCHHW